MLEIKSFEAITLDRRPDVVKFVPGNDDYAVVGTYTLVEDEPVASPPTSQQRLGSLVLMHVENDKMNIIDTLQTPFGVYDLHFAPGRTSLEWAVPARFAVATSTGSVAFYEVLAAGQKDPSHPKLSHLYTIQYFSKDVLVTSLDWHVENDTIAMTLSDGRVCVGRVRDPATNPVLSVELTRHEFQAWNCSFVVLLWGDSPAEEGLMSGGDDATLRCTPVENHQRSALELRAATTDPVHQPWTERKIHQAGVTAVVPIISTHDGVIVLTGSYDDCIRLLRVPHTGRREVLAEANLEGGVFRIKIVEHIVRPGLDAQNDTAEESTVDQQYTLCVSCMQAGARIVTLHRIQGHWHFEVESKFDQNQGTLLYASDCQTSRDSNGCFTVLSTSFEDCRVYLWKAKA